MDITAPPRQTTSTSPESNTQPLPVHAAPVPVNEDQNNNDAADSVDNSIGQQELEADASPMSEAQLPQYPKKVHPAPVAAITIAVLAMLGLSAIAITIYLNS